jgi:hypothetical protein
MISDNFSLIFADFVLHTSPPPEWDIDDFIIVCRRNMYNHITPVIPTSPQAREESPELLHAASLFPLERG